MATVLLSAAGSAFAGSLGGSLFGLGLGTVGQAVGAIAGSVLDEQLLGSGSAPVEVGKARSLRLQSSTEGAAIPQVFGRMRLAGQVIWSTRYRENIRETTQGGKATGGQRVREYDYTISFAVGLCEGPIDRIGRVWADGQLLDLSGLNYRVYSGDESQLPDPKIEAVEGTDTVPAYRGMAYVVFEDLPIEAYGNRIPQLNFEVFRSPAVTLTGPEAGLALGDAVRAVCLSPGTGEFALDPEMAQVVYPAGGGTYANVNNADGRADIMAALDQLDAELPACDAVSMVVSWFGDDLRCGRCRVEPRVEKANRSHSPDPWSVAGLTTATARTVSEDASGRVNFGGTPADGSVIRAIAEMNARGKAVMLYPFLLMDLPGGNGLPDPYGGAEQAAFPWRGRITLDAAPGQPGSVDQTGAAAVDVAQFFGTAQASDFQIAAGAVTYTGPDEWTWRRFVLHLAALGAAAGGIEAICIGTELRGLTTIRDGATSFPAVTELQALAAEVRALLPSTKITYAADWSEYFGHQPQDGSGDVLFHLDPLWADPNIDAIGIDDYTPLSDWRAEATHADVAAGSVYSLPYLKGQVEGGEYYDWYYASPEDRAAQIRTPIEDAVEIGGPSGTIAPAATPDYALAVNEAETITSADRRAPVLIRAEITLPNPLTDGVLFRAGAAYIGFWMGLRDGGTVLRARAGSGGSLPNANAAVIDHDVSGLAGQTVTLLVWIDSPAGTIDLYVDGALVGTGTAPSGLTGASWTGGATALVTPVSTSNSDIGDEPETPFPDTNVIGTVNIWVDTLPVEGTGGGGNEISEPWIFRPKDIRGWWDNPHHNRPGGVRDSAPTAWVPRSKPIWLTEIGCPAVDMGANQPNVFYDGKSSESALPYFSRGARDDEMQRRYLQAKIGYWAEPGNNPVSAVYGGEMVPTDRIYVWTWDARPWPDFPVRESVWADGPSHRLGHWLSGRISSGSLAEIVTEICARAGLASTDIDVSRLFGSADGYVLDQTLTGRAALQPLMQAFGFDVFESGGKVVFASRQAAVTATLDTQRMVPEAGRNRIAIKRETGRSTEAIDQVRLSYLQSESDYRAGTAEARRPAGSLVRVSESSLHLSLSGSRAQQISDRWLAESALGQQRATFALPPSVAAVEPGDVVTLPGAGALETWRIDKITEGTERSVEAVRTDPGLYLLNPAAERQVEPEAAVTPGPLTVEILDLPLADGSDRDHQPRLAVASTPWPGDVAVFRSVSGTGFELAATARKPAVIGVTATALAPGAPNRWHRVGLDVLVPTGTVFAAERLDVLNGANRLAVQRPDGVWEVLQFQTADLVGQDTYRLGTLLRGQRGTEALAPLSIPAGARIVVIDDALVPLPIAAEERALTRTWRIGPARYDHAHASYVEVTGGWPGTGLRPFAPAHLSAVRDAGDLALSWVRQTRVGGDTFEAFEVALAEESEAYRLIVRDRQTVLRTEDLTEPRFTYTQAMQTADGVGSTISVGVAQRSALYGFGPERGLEIDV